MWICNYVSFSWSYQVSFYYEGQLGLYCFVFVVLIVSCYDDGFNEYWYEEYNVDQDYCS